MFVIMETVLLLLLNIGIFSASLGDSCDSGQCNSIISMPLLDNMQASLKADLDVSQMNEYLKKFIQQEVNLAVKAAVMDNIIGITDNLTERININMEEKFADLSKEIHPAFFATLTKKLTPLPKQTIKFDSVKTNIGGGYSTETGIFTVPKEGLYMISSTVRAWAKKYLHCELWVNDAIYTSMFGSDWTQGTANLVVQLKKGDQVRVVKNPYPNEIISSGHLAMFSGFLIA